VLLFIQLYIIRISFERSGDGFDESDTKTQCQCIDAKAAVRTSCDLKQFTFEELSVGAPACGEPQHHSVHHSLVLGASLGVEHGVHQHVSVRLPRTNYATQTRTAAEVPDALLLAATAHVCGHLLRLCDLKKKEKKISPSKRNLLSLLK